MYKVTNLFCKYMNSNVDNEVLISPAHITGTSLCYDQIQV